MVPLDLAHLVFCVLWPQAPLLPLVFSSLPLTVPVELQVSPDMAGLFQSSCAL